jgi:hypothetical protein
MKGGFGCSPCCGPTCEVCTRECTEPHTGTAFEPVYTRFFEGVEVGNPSDGYLSATGDNDTSDPYNGMDGTGPWFQQVGGGFSDGGSYGGGTRFPCTYRFSFWRSSYTLGVATIPPASTALTENVVTVTVSTGAVVFPDGRVITSADGAVTLASVPLVSGGALATDPRTNDGTVSFALQCQNTETTFSVQARIRWATQRRQHILYGTVRECYEEGTPCATFCSGSPPPSTLYLTISNVNITAGPSGAPSVAAINALANDWIENKTWVMERVANYCQTWDTNFLQYGPCSGANPNGVANAYVSQWSDGIVRFAAGIQTDVEGLGCYGASIGFRSNLTSTPPVPICNSYSQTGTGGIIRLISAGGVDYDYTGTFDWKVES